MDELIKKDALEMLENLAMPLNEYYLKHFGKTYIEVMKDEALNPPTLQDLMPDEESIDAIRGAMWVACAACGIPPHMAVYTEPSEVAKKRALESLQNKATK